MTENDHGAAPSAAQGQACSDPTVATIRDLNDWFRRSFTGGLVVMTKGVESLGVATVRRVCIRVKSFETFSADNDPYGEHDFGSFDLDGERFFWKIDYFDPTLNVGSPDPANPKLTCRVLTIMLASEY